MPLLINSLLGGHTHKHIDIHTETILRNTCQPAASSPDLKINYVQAKTFTAAYLKMDPSVDCLLTVKLV